MHIHISAICGTFMGGIAQLARELGHTVTGSDANVYPPMSDQLRRIGVELMEGYQASNLAGDPDLVVIGNALSRGNPEIEAVLERNIPYTSGPAWLLENVLKDRWVLAVAGTHGKTTCSSLLAWILEDANLHPGFLIGGVPENFGCSARLGDAPFFVVEADEYDTAFFDKRSKFVHYQPRTLLLNNLEFDHADIFKDLEAIKTQFHHLIRTVPASGKLLINAHEPNLKDVLDQGCWSQKEEFAVQSMALSEAGVGWSVEVEDENEAQSFTCIDPEGHSYEVEWLMQGRHNILNALGVIAAARHSGVPVKFAIQALATFKGIKRRMEKIADIAGVCVYDDFAHHPTAIETTLKGLRSRVKRQIIYATLEIRSNTMRMGYHRDKLITALKAADFAVVYTPTESLKLEWEAMLKDAQVSNITLCDSVDLIVAYLDDVVTQDAHILIMSNGSFNGIHKKITTMLESR